MNMVFERYPNGGGEMLLALALADHSHDDGSNIYPSIAQLATKTRQSERAVQYQLRRMEESTWLELVNEGDGGRGRRREYRINRSWMKGEEIAPIQKKGADSAPAERVQSTAEKGANGDGKGCKAFAPTDNRKEPSENHQAVGFDEFWKAYPKTKRKAAKPQCMAKWATKGLDAIGARVVAALEAAKRSDEWRKDRGQFIPAPLVWLNQERWEAFDETDTAPQAAAVDEGAQWRADQAERARIVEEQRQARIAKRAAAPAPATEGAAHEA